MRLLKQVVKRRIMIVFSDGQPAAVRSGASKITKQAIEEIEARRDMEIYGIGIMSAGVERYYKDHQVIDDTSKLEAALLSVIKSKILKG
jgi:cobalamin biosynthesis protein CobT